jgi:tRNA1Val (adenine37-N6)-methyltransferase
MSEVFKFKQFEIHQGRCAMKVNTDAILLGAWSNVSDKSMALDIGTGTGIIAIMIAQRNEKLITHGIEIDELTFIQASENMTNCPFASRLQCIHDSIQNYARVSELKYDLIVSNPPFFTGGTFSHNENKASVRHTIKLSHIDLLLSVKLLITINGHFDLVLPYIEGLRFVEMALKYDFGLVHITEVKSGKEKNTERLLIRLGHKFNGTAQTSEIMIYNSPKANDYSKEMVALTRDFYLFMD